MKSIVFIFGLAFANDPLQGNKEANSVLRAKRSPSDDCGFWGCTTAAPAPKSYDEQQKDAADAFITKYHLTSVESWEEMKDKFDENSFLPKIVPCPKCFRYIPKEVAGGMLDNIDA